MHGAVSGVVVYCPCRSQAAPWLWVDSPVDTDIDGPRLAGTDDTELPAATAYLRELCDDGEPMPSTKVWLPPPVYWTLRSLFHLTPIQLPYLLEGNVNRFERELSRSYVNRRAVSVLQREFLRRMTRVQPPDAMRCAGTLLYGPPGSGKTELVRAMLTYAGFLKSFSGTASDLNKKYFGETERRLRKILDCCKGYPGIPVIVFFDEIDSIVQRRSSHTSDTKVDIMSGLLFRVGSGTCAAECVRPQWAGIFRIFLYPTWTSITKPPPPPVTCNVLPSRALFCRCNMSATAGRSLFHRR